jgi:hypothetical protein
MGACSLSYGQPPHPAPPINNAPQPCSASSAPARRLPAGRPSNQSSWGHNCSASLLLLPARRTRRVSGQVSE